MTRIALTVGMLMPAVALASGDGSGPGTDFYVYLVDFLILVVPLVLLVAPRLRKVLRDRHEAIRREMEEARALHREAEARLREAEERMQHFEQEAASLLQEFRRQGEAERESLLQEGIRISRKLEEDTAFRISQAGKMARAEIVETLLTRAFAITEQRAAEQSHRPVSDRLVSRLVEEVKA